MKFALLDYTHFKRKRSHKIERSLNCTEWKSALTRTINPNFTHNRMTTYTDNLSIYVLSSCNDQKHVTIHKKSYESTYNQSYYKAVHHTASIHLKPT